MSVVIETGRHNGGIQIVRTVVDTLRACNSHCKYCYFYHENFGKPGDFLPAKTIKEILMAADNQSQLDVVLSGGEITLHPEFAGIMDATHGMQRTGVTMITNGIAATKEKVKLIRDSNVSRVCMSLDGVIAEQHNFGRGNNFDKALRGLYELQESGKNISVLTTIHSGNIDHLLELSEFLAANKLANQHHFACLYHSGNARENWKELIVPFEKIEAFQKQFDDSFDSFKNRGLHLVFNHYWQLTGLRPKSGNPRELLSHQLGEQNKATWVVVRFNGDVNSTVAYWGRESTKDPKVGNLFSESADTLFEILDIQYRDGNFQQLSRADEARHKFVVKGIFDKEKAAAVIKEDKKDVAPTFVPSIPMSEIDVMQTPIDPKYIDQMAAQYVKEKGKYRIVKHVTGVYLFYQNATAHAILLNQGEFDKLQAKINSLQCQGEKL